MSYETVADGDVAAVVTFLEMHAPTAGEVPPSPLRLEPIVRADLDAYRMLFRRVGSPWLWFSRLAMSDDALAAIVHDTRVALFAVVDPSSAQVGLVELDFRAAGQCELAFVGLIPELAGQGHGRWLLSETLRRAWAGVGVSRVHLHTCSLDHPAALGAYRRAGFTPFRRSIERFPDPRLLGILPADAAPQIPLLGTPLPTAASPAA